MAEQHHATQRAEVALDHGRAALVATHKAGSSTSPVTATGFMLHGFSGSGLTMAPLAQALAPSHQLTLIDLPHHGQTELVPATGPTTAEATPVPATMADAVAVVDGVAKAEGLDTFDVVGYSMGGRTALSYALAHPGRVRSLVLISAGPGLADAGDRTERIAADEALAQRIIEGGLDQFREFWDGLPLFEATVDPHDALGAEPTDLIHRANQRADPAELAASLRGMGTGHMPPLHSGLRQLDKPVLIVVGSADAKYVAIGETMAQDLPRATLHVVEGAAHRPHIDRPRATATAIAAFLDSHKL